MRTGIAVACAAVGLVALPALVASQPLTLIWLLGEVLLSIASLALLPALGRALGDAIGQRTREAISVTPSQTRLIGYLLVLGIMLITVQAMLRRSLALLLGADGRAALTVESAVAATALTFVLALAVWLFQTARPVVQSLTMRAIDVAIPTIGAAPLAEATMRTTSLDGEATVLAPRRPPEADPTIATDADATIAADPDVTLRVVRPRQ